MNNMLVLPVIIPVLTAILVLAVSHKKKAQRALTLLGIGLLFAVDIYIFAHVWRDGYLVDQMGNWPAPFGITIVADLLSAVMITLTAIIGFCVAVYSFSDIGVHRAKNGFYPAYCILLAGLNGAFLTGDLFNLYVWFEVILISSFILLALGSGKAQLEGAVKYAVLNLVATLILLTAIAFLYGLSGTLNMADLAYHLASLKYHGLITVIAVIFIVAFGMKAALFPLFFWLPASYHTTSFSTSAIFSGLLTKVGVYALIRIFTLMFLQNHQYLHMLLLTLALFTLVMGMIGAVAQRELRRIFAFSLVSHVGYMIIGLAVMTPLALMGSLFYMIQHMLVKSNLFLASGIVKKFSGNNSTKRGSGLYKVHPYFSILFFISAFSLAGLPPFSGFWAKLLLVKATFVSHYYFTLFVIVLISLSTLYVVARVWQTVFLRPKSPDLPSSAPLFLRRRSSDFASSPPVIKAERWFLLLPVTLLTTLILLIGIFPYPVYHLTQMMSQQLLHPSMYIHAVMGQGAL
jgi:multicomponent Na+:H+ antiporter subunit D